MTNKIIFFFCFLCFVFETFSQASYMEFAWAKSMGSIYYDYSYDIAVDAGGNIYTTGYFLGTVDFDPGPGTFYLSSERRSMYVCKLDANGNFVWAKVFTGRGKSQGNAIALDTTNGLKIYITGSFSGAIDFDPGPNTLFMTTSTTKRNAFVCKLDENGNLDWVKKIGNNNYCGGYSIALDQSGNPLVTGLFKETVDFDPNAGIFNLTARGNRADAFICKLDNSGNFVWVRQMSNEDLMSVREISVNTYGNGDIYVVGWFQGTVDFNPNSTNTFRLNSVANYDIFITKLDANGNFIWAKQMGGLGFNEGKGIALDKSGNGDVYITGTFQRTVDFDPGPDTFEIDSAGDFDIFVAKLDKRGNFVWAKAMGGTGYEFGFSIDVDYAGTIYTTGYFRGTCDFNPDNQMSYNLSAIGNDEIFISKLDNNGNFLGVMQAGSYGDDYGLSLTLDRIDNIYVTGAFYSPTAYFGTNTLTNTFSGGYTCDVFITKLKSASVDVVMNHNTCYRVFPNPAKDYLYITSPNDIQKYTGTITDITGKTIKKIKSNTIYIGDMSSGTYYINLMIEHSFVSKKIIKRL